MIRPIEIQDPEWDLVAGDLPPEPYCDRTYLAAVAAADGTRPLLIQAQGSDWSAVYVIVLCPLSNGTLMARTPEYGGPYIRSHGPVGKAAAELRRQLDEHIPSLGAIEEVVLLSPWLPDRRAIAEAWSCKPEKEICLVRLRELPKLWEAMQRRRRRYIRHIRRQVPTSVSDFTLDGAARFSVRYTAAMDRLDASPRWRFGPEYFDSLATRAGGHFMLVEVEGEAGGAAGLFLVVGTRAAHYLAARWGAEAGASNFALWHGLERLRDAGVDEVLLGGGLTSRPNDSLLGYKVNFGSYTTWLHLGGRIYSATSLREAIDNGQVRPPPKSSLTL